MPFPFETRLSLELVIAYWQAREADPNPGLAWLAQAVGLQVAAKECCRGPLAGIGALADQAELVSTLLLAVCAPATAPTALSGAVVPFGRQCFYSTPRFAEVLLGRDDQTIKQPLNVDLAALDEKLTQLAYLLILSREYGAELPAQTGFIFTVPDYRVGLYRHYGLSFDATFIRVLAHADKPVLTPAQVQELLQNRHRPELWRQLLPPECFVLEGFHVLHLVDVTVQETLSELKYDLLERDVLQAPVRLEQIQEKLRVLFARPALQVGIAAYDERQQAFVDFGRQLNHSFLTKQLQGQALEGEFRQLYARLLAARRPLVLPDVATAPELPAGLRAQMLALGVHSAILAALPYGPDTVGLLELGAAEAGALDEFAAELVAPLVPLFAVAVKRNAEDLETRVQALVKEKFTAIHPSLEWRFNDAARRLLAHHEAGNRQAEIEAIVFEDVYPLYGACDIRGSSTARGEAIQRDLIEHLTLAGRVLKKAAEVQQLPLLDELRFYVSKNLRRLRQGLLSGDEVSIYDSLRTEVEPLFEHFGQQHPELRPTLAAYWQRIDPRLGVLYHHRRDFEQSVTRLNETIADYLDAEEAKAQAMFPHYFQRLKTDGVEFNIYVGASLVQGRTFDLVFLKNLRLWQLLTMVELTRRTHALLPELPVPLETTQLLLIHAQPLSIRFRQDERQFDVDGPYNIRYEILKKRIDKATVFGTGERLTQPGHLALVYSQPREATEYLEYLGYLRDRALLEPGVEELELEELQGVKGLLALRVRVKLA